MPAPHTPLAALPAVVIDLETTGLDVRRDRVVQAAAVGMLGGKLLEAPRLDVLVSPGIPVPPEAIRIHGLGERELAGAPAFPGIAAELLAALEGRVVIGHHVGFDLAILRHEAGRAGVAWRECVFLDVALLVAALEPSLPDQGLETIARFLGVPVQGRHNAMGDALIAARAFARLLPRLRAAGVHTLGEALVFSARRGDLLRRQAAAGWSVPESAAPEPEQQPSRIDTYIFERRLAEVMSSPPIIVPPETTLREAAWTMAELRIGALLVGARGAAPRGIITERDLLRAGADARIDAGATAVSAVMSAPVHCLSGEEMLYRALGRMDRLGIRHLCVSDPSGNAVGMVSQRDLLHHRARSALALGDGVAEAHDAASLALAHARVTEVAARLVEEGLDGVAVAFVVSGELRALTARAAELVAARLAAEGVPAPAPWCVLVLGSAGRGESLLGADQDNALVHAGSDADGWFSRLGEGIAELLDEAGVPRCRGGVMAANAAWRGTPDEWRGRVGGWLQRASPKDLLNVDIFFDLVPVAGDTPLGEALHAEAVAEASRHPAFIALLAQSAASMRPSIGPFGRLRARNGRIDLKLGGLLPLVGLARTLALRIGCVARGTPERLRAAAAAGRLASVDADMLLGVHARLLTRVLRQQLADRAAGVPLSGRVAAAALERDEARLLREDLSRLDDIVQEAERAASG